MSSIIDIISYSFRNRAFFLLIRHSREECSFPTFRICVMHACGYTIRGMVYDIDGAPYVGELNMV